MLSNILININAKIHWKFKKIITIFFKINRFLKVGNTSKEKEKKPGSWRQNILLKTVSNGIDSKHMDDDPMKFLPALPKKSNKI